MPVVVRQWGSSSVIMQVCALCGVGAGVTRYPDGPWHHAEEVLRDGLCQDCRRWAARNPRRAARCLPWAATEWRGRREVAVLEPAAAAPAAAPRPVQLLLPLVELLEPALSGAPSGRGEPARR
jgi:hypothetical protein